MARYWITLMGEGECNFSVDLPTDDPSEVTEEFMETIFSHIIGVPEETGQYLVKDWGELADTLGGGGILITKSGEEVYVDGYTRWGLRSVEREVDQEPAS